MEFKYTEITMCLRRVVNSDVRYEIFFVLPITIIAQQIYHDTIIITICNSSPM